MNLKTKIARLAGRSSNIYCTALQLAVRAYQANSL